MPVSPQTPPPSHRPWEGIWLGRGAADRPFILYLAYTTIKKQENKIAYPGQRPNSWVLGPWVLVVGNPGVCRAGTWGIVSAWAILFHGGPCFPGILLLPEEARPSGARLVIRYPAMASLAPLQPTKTSRAPFPHLWQRPAKPGAHSLQQGEPRRKIHS